MAREKGRRAQTAPGDNSQESAHNPRTEFFNVYEKEGEVYDSRFGKKYDDDLNITLIFVSDFFVTRLQVWILACYVKGWSFLRRQFGFHHQRAKYPPTR
jgi:hypothetical protein